MLILYLKIHVAGQDTEPFSLPFSVKNNSHFLAMNDIHWKCNLLSLNNRKNTELENIAFVRPGNSIDPTRQANFTCGVNLSTNLTHTKSLQIEMEATVSYKTLWFSRLSNPRKFTWFAEASPPRWVESD